MAVLFAGLAEINIKQANGRTQSLMQTRRRLHLKKSNYPVGKLNHLFLSYSHASTGQMAGQLKHCYKILSLSSSGRWQTRRW